MTSRRDKARAVFLSAIMIISMVGMSAAFAGTAVAQAPDSGGLSVDVAQSDTTVTIEDIEPYDTGEEDSLNILAEDEDGEFEDTSIIDSDSDSEESWSTEFQPNDFSGGGLDDGTYTIFLSTETDSGQNEVGTLTVDNDGPTIEAETPENEEWVSDNETLIEYNVSDDLSGVNESTIEVDLDDEEGEILSDAGTDDGAVDYDGEETLTIDVTQTDAEAFADGQVDVTVSADDEAENEASHSIEFYVDTLDPVVNNFDPEDGAVVSDSDRVITFDVEDNLDSDLTAHVEELDIAVNVENEGISQEFQIRPDSETDDGVSLDANNGDGTVTIDPDAADPSLNWEDGSMTIDVTVEDRAENVGTNDSSYTISTDNVTATVTYEGENVDIGSTVTSNNENGTLEIDLGSSADTSIDNETVKIEVDGPSGTDYSDGQTFSSEDEELFESIYDSETETVTLDASTDEIDAFEQGDDGGEYTVTVTADDDAESDDNKLDGVEIGSFYVDTTTPVVDSIDIGELGTEDPVSEPDFDSGENNDIFKTDIVVTFEDDSVVDETEIDAGSVEADIIVDGDVKQTVDDFVSVHDTAVESTDVALDFATYDELEDDDAEVNVTVASDSVSNEMDEDDGDAKSFNINTVSPTIELEGVDEEIGGFANFGEFVAETEDVEHVDAEIFIGERSNTVDLGIGELDDLASVDTRYFPDGTHKVEIVVRDENDNSDADDVTFDLNNDDPVTIDDSDAFNAFVNKSDDNDGDQIEFSNKYDASPTPLEIGENAELDLTQFFAGAEDFNEETSVSGVNVVGDTVEITEDASAGDTFVVSGEAESVDFQIHLEFEVVDQTVDVNVDDNPEELVVETHQNVDDFDELTLKVTNDDDYVEDVDLEFTLEDDDFVIDAENGTFTVDHDVYDVGEELRNGDFDAEADAKVNGVEREAEDSFEVNKNAAAIELATVTDADERFMQVEVQFNQPVNTIGTTDVDGVDVDVDTDTDDLNEGLLTVNFNEEFQTGDAPDLKIDNVDQTYGGSGHVSGDIVTQTYELEEGFSVISVPAVTGDVDADAFDDDGIEAVWAYDAADGEWTSFAPGANDNDLDALEGGQGYVVNANADATISVNAENLPSAAGDNGVPQLPTEQQLTEGWNLVGHYQLGSQTQSEALNTIDDSVDVFQLGYTGDNPSELEPGAGYWANLDEDDNYAPTSFGDVGPDLFNVEVDNDGEPIDGTTEYVDIIVDVDPDDAPVSTISIVSETYDVDIDESVNIDGDSERVVIEDVDVDVDYGDSGFFNAMALDTDGNFGTDSVEVDAASVTTVTAQDDASATAGDQGTIEVTVEDENGNDVPDETVSLADDDGLSGLDKTAETNNDGVATFEFNEQSAGEYAPSFEINGITDDAAVTIDAADADDLEAADTTETAGDDGEVVVTVEDEFGNAVEDETVEVEDAADLDGLEGTLDTDESGEAAFSFNEDSVGEYKPNFQLEDDNDISDTATVTIE